jgi:hypothetical protein
VAEFFYLDELLQRAAVHGAKVDVILPDGTHRYWSTHCRHEDHEACAENRLYGEFGAFIARKPAQCKHCSAPCICECHKAQGGLVNPAPWLVVGESGPEVDRA